MALLKVAKPPFDVDEWKRLSHVRRIRPLVLRWVEYGTDSPGAVHIFYILKIVAYCWGGVAIIATTPGLGGVTEFPQWWTEPIVYQKAVVFTMLFEVLGFGGGTGPLFFKFLPPFTAFLHFFRPGTIRLPPWPGRVPFTSGDRRSVVDVLLYAGFVAAAVHLLLSPGSGPVPPGAEVGLLAPSVILPVVILLGALGLRDKTVYLAARAEMYWIACLIFFFPYADMMIGLKFALVAIWWGAGVSKLTHIFPSVVSVMISNSPFRPRWFKRMMYRDPLHDIRPSLAAGVLAHTGTVIELGLPVVLLLGDGGVVSAAAVALMIIFHLHIISTIPVGVPNEWNVFMIFGTLFLFWAHADLGLSSVQHPALIVLVLLALLTPVVVGNMRPDLVSFLPAMRYYAGNWAIGLWCFRDGADRRLGECVTKASGLMTEQLTRLFDADTSELTNFRFRAFRSMHPQGRALNGLLSRALDDVDRYTVQDGEPITGTLIGWNFGDGHLHNEQLLAAVQKRCRYEPGELVMVFLESQPIHVQRQRYRIVDAATGEIEAGYVYTKDMLTRQPWLSEDDVSFPVEVISTGPGRRYENPRASVTERE
ncbi:DUF3556 domain-containing protein [Pseudonocardia eucalypti]|uniref:DUF3556 domain-containing protein n=1 Tax=Pseudonocardia eucalypti TaxID=648755 RepID=A0ABP9PKQ9_9PSEU|nr:hypothetical protein [Pseudonocardia eucalypti]